MAQRFLDGLERSRDGFDRIRNVSLLATRSGAPVADPLPTAVEDAIELVCSIRPPRASRPFQFNHDYSDIVPMR
jgi:hypothetical protein